MKGAPSNRMERKAIAKLENDSEDTLRLLAVWEQDASSVFAEQGNPVELAQSEDVLHRVEPGGLALQPERGADGSASKGHP